MREIERMADSFAGEFLMPAAGITDEFPKPVSVHNLLQLKSRWGVSIASLVMRAGELQIISKRRVQQQFRTMNKTGLRRREPGDIPIEKPRAFRKMVEIVYGNPPNIRRFAADFDFPLQLANALVSAHAKQSEVVASVPPETGNIVRFDQRSPA